jgi:uncharacterized protein (TIGR02145 family)
VQSHYFLVTTNKLFNESLKKKSMKNFLTTVMLCAAIGVWFAGCKEDNPEPKSELLVSPATLNAGAAAGEYTLAITGNVDWAATTNVEWLTIEPATGNGNAAITITVEENPKAETRTATLSFTSGEVNNTAIVMQEARPFYAASTRTWTVGNQIWSDVIQMPECNKEEYPIDPYTPHCRKYTDRMGTDYFYNWSYANFNGPALCPSPWRVPSNTDFMNLDMALGGSGANRTDDSPAWVDEQYINVWGGTYIGGIQSSGSSLNRETAGYYWSSIGNSSVTAYGLAFAINGLVYPQVTQFKQEGMAIRCVKDTETANN